MFTALGWVSIFICRIYTLCFSVTWNKWAWFCCPATRTCSQQHAAQPATSPSSVQDGKPGGGCRKRCFEAAAHQKRDQLGERKKLLKSLRGINKEIASKIEDQSRQSRIFLIHEQNDSLHTKTPKPINWLKIIHWSMCGSTDRWMAKHLLTRHHLS